MRCSISSIWGEYLGDTQQCHIVGVVQVGSVKSLVGKCCSMNAKVIDSMTMSQISVVSDVNDYKIII